MVAAHHSLPDLDALPPHELKVLILSQHEQLLSKDEQLASRDTEIEHLKLLIAKLRRMQFGRSSEMLDRQIEQLELRLDELQATQAENTDASQTSSVAAVDANVKKKPARVFCEFAYRTKKSWSRARRVVAKAEQIEGKENSRYLVTSLGPEAWPARKLYRSSTAPVAKWKTASRNS